MEARLGQMGVNYSARGNPTYHLELWHDGLNKHRVIRGESEYLVTQKARLQIAEWEERWADASAKAAQRSMKAEGKRLQEERKSQAADLSAAAISELDELAGLLKATLMVDDRIDWESLKDHARFPEERPRQDVEPSPPAAPRRPREPQPSDLKYAPQLGLLDKLMSSRRLQRVAEAGALFDAEHAAWAEEVRRQDQGFAVARENFER
jgi:restriction system protein